MQRQRSIVSKLLVGIAALFATVAAGLLAINVYGLTQELRPAAIGIPDLRFGDRDVRISREELFMAAKRTPGESDAAYAERLTYAIADGIAHIHWDRYDPDQFHQRVPIWENYILWAAGRFSGIPEFERYHFSSPEKSMERGIGICGDASILMSQLLDREGIRNRIITVPGHVMVEVALGAAWQLFDPDFGVVIGASADALRRDPDLVRSIYLNAGFRPSEARLMKKLLSKPPRIWGRVDDFIAKKYYFEKVAYPLKWLFPVMLLLLSVYMLKRGNDVLGAYLVER